MNKPNNNEGVNNGMAKDRSYGTGWYLRLFDQTGITRADFNRNLRGCCDNLYSNKQQVAALPTIRRDDERID